MKMTDQEIVDAVRAALRKKRIKRRRQYMPGLKDYLESDRDYLENNNDVAVALLDAFAPKRRVT